MAGQGGTGRGGGKKRLVAERRYPAASQAKPKSKSKAKAKPKRAAPTRRRKAAPKRSSNIFVRVIGGMIRWVLRLIWLVFSRGALAGAVVLGLAIFYVYTTLPPFSELLDGRARGSVTLTDRNGAVFAWRGEQFGGQITADTVSPHLKNAIVATEDRRFYKHFGLSPRGIASAVKINLSEGRGPLSGHGGSTLTQQVAKLLCLGVPFDPKEWKSQTEYEADCRQGSITRKAKEAVYAMAMEARYSKDEILSIYMNRAYLGAGANGFEAASERYFGISAADVNIAQSAMLAGLLTAPSRYAPTSNLKRSQERAGIVLLLMNQQGFISDAERAEAKAHPAELSEAAQQRAGGYYADWVMGAGPDFLTRETTEDVIIETTFDPRLQNAAEEALTWVFDNKVREGSKAQAAIVIMSADGAVRGMVGGRKLRGITGAFNRATQAKRQPGSAFKPFVFATALDMGWSYDSPILDEPITVNIPGSGPWSPQNYDRKFHGMVTVTEALQKSFNIPAVKLAMDVGLENVRTVAQMFGIESDLAQGPALALGASESTLLEMTGAYAGILNGGSSVTPYGLRSLRLKGTSDEIMGQDGGLGERVITPAAAEQLIYMMYNVVQNGTGTRARLDGVEAAGKTGTTQAARDAWFMGFTADYVVGVWMGYDDNSPLTGVTGGGLPADIWHETMKRVQQGQPGNPLPMLRPSVPPQIPANSSQSVSNSGARQNNDKAQNVLGDILSSIFGKKN
ncbi:MULTISPECIES: transglycosylase domain-containing protein [Pacificibacter]|uniref:transglycosylase domain-containing protein n=1 Tax=Pacificibacter TaxID=1042323 RepID=UPI001C090968|nr:MULTISPECIES: transglycosylase domain-containing protein [Pacificibacter]MBU2937302.1 penicillin-binding protein [Pacificibacter marinus]MDO6615297.1 transglycosylase domain-containing protein [Pacificibacter sp. 1_MG-2023]